MKNFTPLKRWAAGCAAVSILALAGACSRNIQNDTAVRQGVIDYLQARKSDLGVDVNLMDVQVNAVSFQQSVARASITFRPKGSGPDSGGMSMSYTLDRKANKWVVRPREAGGASPHDGAEMTATPEMPAGHPAIDTNKGTASPGALPPGHSPVGSKE